MHPMAFLQKRGHLCAVARGREMFAGVRDMTPARFDLLYLINEQFIDVVAGLKSNQIEQARIPWILGLKRQTVWKMVERLVQLGLVKKTKDVRGLDPRRNILSLTPEGLRRIRQAYGVAFSESAPLPRDAPTEGDVPRYWRRPELADVRRDMFGQPIPPKKTGREVAKIYTSFACKRIPSNVPDRRYRYLAWLDDMMMTSLALATALGDTSTLIYRMREPEFTGPMKRAREWDPDALGASGGCWGGLERPGVRVQYPELQLGPIGTCQTTRARRRCRRETSFRFAIAQPLTHARVLSREGASLTRDSPSSPDVGGTR